MCMQPPQLPGDRRARSVALVAINMCLCSAYSFHNKEGLALINSSVWLFMYVLYFSYDNKYCLRFSICACHPCAGATLIFSESFRFQRMIPEGNPQRGEIS